MQLKRQSIEAWQNEKHYSKGNNTSENPIPEQEIFKPVDHVIDKLLLAGVMKNKHRGVSRGVYFS